MKSEYLFAISPDNTEVLVSQSAPKSNAIESVERIAKADNEALFHSVSAMTVIAKSPLMDMAIFKATDKVCQLLYQKWMEEKS